MGVYHFLDIRYVCIYVRVFSFYVYRAKDVGRIQIETLQTCLLTTEVKDHQTFYWNSYIVHISF